MTGIGAWQDLKTNEVPNKVWLVFGLLGGIMAAVRYGWTVFLGVHAIFAVIISIVIIVAFYKFEAFIGGADAKAVIALSAILSFFAVIPLVVSVGLLVAFLAVFTAIKKDKLSLKEVLDMKAPFLPFLFTGVAFAFIGLVLM